MEEQKPTLKQGEVKPQAAPPLPPSPNAQPEIPPKGGQKRAPLPSLPKPHPSFLVALITIIATISAGIGLAVAIGKLTQRGMKGGRDSQTAPMVTTTPTIALEREEIRDGKGASPSADSSPSGSFGSMLQEDASEASEASQPATPNQ